LRGFFEPDSVVVVGVSDRPHNLARAIVINLTTFAFQGRIQLVGTRGGSFEGMPIHRSVLELPEPADLAVVLAPARSVPGILDECGQAGIRRVIVESAGFGEKGGDGDDLQRRLLDTAARWGIRLIGPNCLGVVNIANGLVLPFNPMPPIYRAGGVSVLSQSGGVGIAYLSLLAHEGMGVARFASIGNKLDVDESDLLAFLIDDPSTTIVVMYLEGIRDGRRLLRLLERADKPVLVQKANRGRLSQDIASSHTASLAGDDAVVDAALAQTGAVRFDDGHSLANAVRALTLPPMRGARLAVISRSGGHAVQVADACERHGFELAAFGPEILDIIQGRCRAGVVRLTNPLDLGDLFDFDTYVALVRAAIEQPGVDGVVFLHTYTGPMERERSRRMVEQLTALGREQGKPVAVVVVTEPQEQAWLRRANGYPLFEEPTDAIGALALLRDHSRRTPRFAPPVPEAPSPAVAEALRQAMPRGGAVDAALALVAAAGIPCAPGLMLRDPAQAPALVEALGAPLAAKVSAHRLSHKSDVGGVRLGLDSPSQLEAAAVELLSLLEAHGAEPEAGVLVQPMAAKGLDLIIGARRDPQFGPVVVAGFGGVLVEIMGQVALRVAPIDIEQARAMLRGLPGSALFDGVRGGPALDVDAAARAVVQLGSLLLAHSSIREIEINPFRIFGRGRGGQALDARVFGEPEPSGQ
jgi:acyl-CoA synthetase (NDP forming)